MSIRSVLVILLALVFGVSAAFGVRVVLQGGAATAANTVPVVVAAVEVPRFSTITENMLTTQEFPKALVPPGSFNSITEAKDRVALTALVKGETVLLGKVTGPGGSPGLSLAIPKGMRAFTIRTPNLSAGVAGFVLPGNQVDVLLTVNGNTNDGTGGGSTTTRLQRVEILAVDQRVETPNDYKADPNLRSVTLLVTPDQAAKLELGQNRGTLHLSLRNPEDTDTNRIQVATMNSLRFYQEAAWDERLKSLLEAGAKLLPKKSAAVVPAGAEEPAERPERLAPLPPIRTLRGISAGYVPLN